MQWLRSALPPNFCPPKGQNPHNPAPGSNVAAAAPGSNVAAVAAGSNAAAAMGARPPLHQPPPRPLTCMRKV
jgi:hypothetical protein